MNKLKHFAVAIFLTLSLFSHVNAVESEQLSELVVAVPRFETPITFNVTLPASYQERSDKRYFVLFDLHPRAHAYLSGLHDWMSHNGEWPWLETIVINSAGYHAEFAKLFEQTAEDPTNTRMLDIFAEQIMPAIESQYRTNGFNIYSGFMSNGAIGLYALFNRPELFDAYFIATPTLANDFLDISSSATDKLKVLDDKIRFVYLAIGQHGYEKAHLAPTEQLVEALQQKAPAALEWHYQLDTEHYYMSRPVLTVINGIEKLFDDMHNDLAADSEISVRGPDAIIAHYETLSVSKYGFPVSAEGSLKKLAKSLLGNDPEKAIEIYQRVTTLYPDSAYAYADLAAAYFSQGNVERAIATQKIAVEKSKTMIEWHQRKINGKLVEYEAMLSQ